MKKKIGLLVFVIFLSSSLIGQVRKPTLKQLVKRDLRYAIFGNDGALQAIETNLTNPEAKISGILHPKGALGKSILSLGFKAKIDENFISVFSKNEFNNTLSLRFRWDFIPFEDEHVKKGPFGSFIKYRYNKVAMLGLPELIKYKQKQGIHLFDSLVVLGFLVHNQIDQSATYEDFALNIKNTQVSSLYIEYTKLFNRGKVNHKSTLAFKKDSVITTLLKKSSISEEDLMNTDKEIRESVNSSKITTLTHLVIKTNILSDTIKNNKYKSLRKWVAEEFLTFKLNSPPKGALIHDLGEVAIEASKEIEKIKTEVLKNKDILLLNEDTLFKKNIYFRINKGTNKEAVFQIEIEVEKLVLKYKSIENLLKNHDKKIIQYEIKKTEDTWVKKKIIWFSFEPTFQVSNFSYGNSSLLTKSIDSIGIVDSFAIDAGLNINMHFYESWKNSNLYINIGLFPGYISNKNNLSTKDYTRTITTTDTSGPINNIYRSTKNGTMYHGDLLQGLGVKLSFNIVYNFTRGIFSPGIFFKQEASFSSVFTKTKGVFFNTEVGLVFNFLDKEKKNTYVSLVPYIGITNLFLNVEKTSSKRDVIEYQSFSDKYLIGIKVGLPINFKPNKKKMQGVLTK